MILHPDGRVEGTPEELAEYARSVAPDPNAAPGTGYWPQPNTTIVWPTALDPDPTRRCPCRPENGGSGLCGCTLGNRTVHC